MYKKTQGGLKLNHLECSFLFFDPFYASNCCGGICSESLSINSHFYFIVFLIIFRYFIIVLSSLMNLTESVLTVTY